MARLARIYQLTEIEMSVTGVLLKFCVVAVLIYTWRKMGSSWLIVTEPRQQIYQPLCLLLIRRTWSQKDKGASMHLFSPPSNAISFTPALLWCMSVCVCAYSQNTLLHNVPSIDLDSCWFRVLQGKWSTGYLLSGLGWFSELFVSASRHNWTLTSGQSESKGGETKSNA